MTDRELLEIVIDNLEARSEAYSRHDKEARVAYYALDPDIRERVKDHLSKTSEAIKPLLEECHRLLVGHHESSLCTWTGLCPVCEPTILERITEALK